MLLHLRDNVSPHDSERSAAIVLTALGTQLVSSSQYLASSSNMLNFCFETGGLPFHVL